MMTTPGSHARRPLPHTGWSDDGAPKYERLCEYAAAREASGGSPCTLWLDKACIDQGDIDASLSSLPVFLSGCQELLVLVGKTYPSRLWCVIEIFVYTASASRTTHGHLPLRS